MIDKKQIAAAQAVLFAAAEPVESNKIASVLGIDDDTMLTVLDELKNKLENLGYFSLEHKKQIPYFVKRIGVVSSETGAVIQDIINVTTRRNDNVDIVLYPVKVQGVGAEQEIANGINFFSNYEKVYACTLYLT